MCVGDYYATRTKTNNIMYCSSLSLLFLPIIFICPFPLFFWHRQSTLFGLYLKDSQRIPFIFYMIMNQQRHINIHT